MHTFPGQIDMASTGDAGFRVKLYLDEEQVEVRSNDGDHWTWPLGHLTVKRAGASRFFLDLGGENVYFTPDDPMAFANRTLGQSAAPGLGQGFLRRQIEKARDEPATEPTVGEVEWIEDPEPAVPKATRRSRRHEHLWTEGRSAGVLRRRCESCGYVSIDITGFVSEFDLIGPDLPEPSGLQDQPDQPVVAESNSGSMAGAV